VAEQRLLPLHRTLEDNVAELTEGVLLGPAREDALRLFPRGARVLAALVNGRTLFLDLSPLILVDDPEVPLRGQAALDALSRTLLFNFPHLHQVSYYIDGQTPVFPDKKNI
ncbi:MAG TPA: GerMN domain-containing protein, partial [Spirochaetia bacterium]|nr:GerMN domain-containing protein [Spirochaetia bacterium]